MLVSMGITLGDDCEAVIFRRSADQDERLGIRRMNSREVTITDLGSLSTHKIATICANLQRLKIHCPDYARD